jgi:Tfp pilus assembly protein PilX
MNKFDRFQHLHHFRHQEQGFTLPMVMGTGAVMTLIAAALIGHAQSNQAIARLQSRSEDAANAAEIGVARVQSFLAHYRFFTTQNAAQWATVLANFNTEIGSCPALSLDNAGTEGQSYAQGEWIETGQTNHQYRMLSYTYQSQPDSNGQVGVAKLTIEGRMNSGLSPAVSRLAVEIPIAIASSPPAPPALWAKRINLSNAAQVTGDVRAQLCPDRNDVDQVPGIASNNLMLDVGNQSIGKIMTVADLLLPQPRLAPTSAISVPVIKNSITLPRSQDFPDDQGNFDYIVETDTLNNSIQLPDGKKITVKVAANQGVNLYTRGDIDLGGGQVTVQVLGDTQPHPEKLRIYGSDRTLKFTIKDSASVMALIQAPAAVGMGWSAPRLGSGLTGSLWLQQWDTATHNSRLPIKQMGHWPDLALRPEEQLGLQLQPLSSWQRPGQ